MILPFAGVCLFAALTGVFSRFWFWIFTYAGSYVTGESLPDGWDKFCEYFQRKLFVYAGFFALAILGLLAARRNGSTARQTGFTLGFLFFSFLGTATGLYFREHYFILVLPALALIVGLAVESLRRALADVVALKKISTFAPWLLFAVVLGANIFYQRQLFFQFPANWVCRVIYQPDPFVEAPALAGYVREHSAANARIAVIGSEPEIYFYSQRHSATGYLYTYALMEPQPYAAKMQREMIDEIETNRPEFLVWVKNDDSWNVRPSSNRAIFDWFAKFSGEFYEKICTTSLDAATGTVLLRNSTAANVQAMAGSGLALYRIKSVPKNSVN
jgi:hypothetical protein